jgi:hypothetical protein
VSILPSPGHPAQPPHIAWPSPGEKKFVTVEIHHSKQVETLAFPTAIVARLWTILVRKNTHAHRAILNLAGIGVGDAQW